MSKQPDKELNELIAKRIDIAATQTKSDDEVVHIAWLADGINVWYQTNGDRGNSPEEARRYIISSVTRLLSKAQLQLVDELMEQKVPVTTHFKGEIPVHFDAVPITTIEKYKANLSGKRE